VGRGGRHHLAHRERERCQGSARSVDLVHVRKHLARESGDPTFGPEDGVRVRAVNPEGSTTATNGRGKSDRPIVPGKPPNKGGGAPSSAEGVEGRGLAKGNPSQRIRGRTQCRETLHSELERVRQAACRDRKLRFTALWHHVYDVRRLREAYYALKRDAAPGVDGQTWRHYGEDLEENLQDLSRRLKRGAYRAKPVRRAYIPKADGRLRPLGVPVLEDKIVQRAVVEVLNAIYETDFLGFSYGYRPGRSPHDALDALSVGIVWRKVSWVLDVDIRGFFDAIDHGWLTRFVEHLSSSRIRPVGPAMEAEAGPRRCNRCEVC
jgi:RNA-directed DNA polymerase